MPARSSPADLGGKRGFGQPYEGDDDEEDDAERDIDELVIEQVLSLMSRPGGDILVFMPTERDILDTTDALRKQLGDKALVLPLFGRLQGGEQRRIFLPAQQRKIIVATNVAETSITVPREFVK